MEEIPKIYILRIKTLQTNKTLALWIYLSEYKDTCYLYLNVYQNNDYKSMCINYEKRFEQWWWTMTPIWRTQITTSNLLIFDKLSGLTLCGHVLFFIFSKWTLILLFWVYWLLFSFANRLCLAHLAKGNVSFCYHFFFVSDWLISKNLLLWNRFSKWTETW
jgi:hypothetical protein